MVRQRLERWRGEAGRREAGAAVRLGLRGGAAAAVRSFLRPWAPRGFSDAGNDHHSGLLASRPHNSSRICTGAKALQASGAAPGSPFSSPTSSSHSPVLSPPSVQSSLHAASPCPGLALGEPALSPFRSGGT